MLDIIKQILTNHKEISGYKIREDKIESNEFFFIKRNLDMDRAKDVHKYHVTVYIDFEENEIKYRGSASANLYPTMDWEEIEAAITEAAFAAGFVKNPYYPLVKPIRNMESFDEGAFSKGELSYWINEITSVVYENDIYDKGGINSCEIFLNKITTRILNSEGVDALSVGYQGMVEFIVTWKEEEEEVELYRCLNFADFDPEGISDEIKSMISIAREKAIAKKTPKLTGVPLLLTREAVKEFFSFYYFKSSAAAVYSEASTFKPGDQLQGEEAKGDLITMTLDPFMENSTLSGSFDEEGFSLEPVVILRRGVLERYHADTRYAHYLKVTPTGNIKNIRIDGGACTLEQLKDGPYLEVAAFSDFSVDEMTGDFCGEIRLAWYNDKENAIPVTGGSISGNINELHQDMFLSKELQKDNEFLGPVAIKLFSATIAGVE